MIDKVNALLSKYYGLRDEMIDINELDDTFDAIYWDCEGYNEDLSFTESLTDGDLKEMEVNLRNQIKSIKAIIKGFNSLKYIYS